MKKDNQVLTDEQVVNVILKNIKQHNFVEDIKKIDSLRYSVELKSEDAKMEINLENILENYRREREYYIIENFIKTHQYIFSKMSGEDVELDVTRVYPAIRLTNFINDDKFEILKDDISDAFSFYYAEDNPYFVSYVTKNIIPKQLSVKDFKMRARQNLINYGWTKHIEEIQLSDIATIYVYQDNVIPFQAQFFIPELYEKQLGKYFYVAVPNHDTAMVLKWHKNPDNHLMEAQHLTVTFKINAVRMYNTQPSPISDVLHRVSERGIRILG